MKFSKLRKTQMKSLRNKYTLDTVKESIARVHIGKCKVCAEHLGKEVGAEYNWDGSLLCIVHFDEVYAVFLEESKKLNDQNDEKNNPSG